MTYDPWAGHPLNDESVEQSKARFIRRELRRYKLGVDAGRAEAAGDAVAFCARWGVQVPAWLAVAARQCAPSRGAGRPPADATDYIRWDMVQECRDRRGDDHIPTTWEATYEAVSEALLGTPHWGTPETIRASYKRALKRMRATPGRYYLRD